MADHPSQVDKSTYSYGWNNPIKYIDRDGMLPSTHTDKDGKVLAVYDDGDLGIYRHIDKFTKGDVDLLYNNFNTSAGGEFMGKSLHDFSFTNFSALEKGVIEPSGYIDFGSSWAMNSVNWIMWDMSGKTIINYALNARQGQKYDVKVKASKQFKSVYYGSILYSNGSDVIYASARDAGNFAAGMIQQRSIIPNYITSVGFGSFNYAGGGVKGMAKGALYSSEKFFIDIFGNFSPFTPQSPLKLPYYGEDKGSGLGIEKGRAYYKSKPYLFNLSK